MIGYRPCKVCGAETNVVDLTAGLCSACKAERAEALAALQRKFDAAVLEGDSETAAAAVDEIAAYQEEWGVRLKDAPSVAQMRRVLGDAHACL